jgi:FkbM family methyltransferase
MKTLPYTLPNGYKIQIIPKTESVICEIWKDLCYERDYHIQNGDVIVDIGANQGIFSLFAAHRGAVVYAVEPDENNYGLLCSNVAKNKLNDKVFHFYCALAQKDGDISLFIPESDYVCSSTFTTTVFSQIELLTHYAKTHVTMSTVKALSLPSLLKKIGPKKISLLKIDTEGAELDILSGACASDLKNVERLVMETHAAYSEREIYRLVQKLGFTVIAYDKLSGVFNTGYLYAESCHREDGRERTKPVAILKVPQSIALGSVLHADAGQSFSAIDNRETPLYYRFTIDGRKGRLGSKDKKLIQFKEKGPHTIRLDVQNSKNTIPTQAVKDDGCESGDYVKKTVWVLSKDYGRAQAAMPLKILGQKYESAVCTEKDFVIPCSDYPKDWDYHALSIGIGIFDVAGKIEEAGVRFCFNGEQRELNQCYQELFFAGFPRENDFCFSLKAHTDFRVHIQWFAKQDAEIEKAPLIECRNNGRYFMGKNSLDHICQIQDNAYFVIDEKVLPHSWNPERVKVCFSVHATDTRGRELEGEVIRDNQAFPLQGWYKEICLCRRNVGNILDFQVKVPEKRVYQITWWPE